MNQERIYKAMRNSGAVQITMGVIAIVSGITMGIILLISGAKVLAEKKNVVI